MKVKIQLNDETGEFFIELPEELMESYELDEGDELQLNLVEVDYFEVWT